MARITRPKSTSVIRCDGGVDEFHDPADIADNKFQSALDIHIDGGKVLSRPSKRVWFNGMGATINGMHEYIDDTGTSRILVHAGTNLYTTTDSAKTSIESGLTSENVHFHTHKGLAYFNGASTQKKVNGAVVESVGLAAPAAAPTVAAGAAGALTGSYAYKITFAIEDGSGIKEYESNPSDFSTSVSLTSEKADLTSIPTSADTRVNARYIYRTSAGGSDPFYVGKISDNTTTTYTDNLADVALGDLVETNHGVPESATYSTRCNERQFWLQGQILRWSEIGITDDYIEYQRSTNFARLPQNGVGVGLRSLYNQATQTEDLYVFQKKGVTILPQGDPDQTIFIALTSVGCAGHDTIVEYNGALVFMTNEKSIGMIRGAQYFDISTRSIPESLKAITDVTYSKASLILDHYYAVTTRIDSLLSYNTRTFVCDLRTVRQVDNTEAVATWYPWAVSVEQYLQLEDGTVLCADNSDNCIYQLDITENADTDADGNSSVFVSKFRTKNFFGSDIFSMKQLRYVGLRGEFTKNILLKPYWWRDQANETVTLDGNRPLFIMGVSKMGDKMTGKPKFIEAPVPHDVCGNVFSLEFRRVEADTAFAISGYSFTYTAFSRKLQ